MELCDRHELLIAVWQAQFVVHAFFTVGDRLAVDPAPPPRVLRWVAPVGRRLRRQVAGRDESRWHAVGEYVAPRRRDEEFENAPLVVRRAHLADAQRRNAI